MIFFFILSESKEKLEGFLQSLNAFHPNLKFNYGKSKVNLIFQMLQSVLTVRSLKLIFIVNPLIVISFLCLIQRILFITKNQLCIAKCFALKGCLPRMIHLKNTLKVYVFGLTSAAIPRNLLTIKLGGFLKAKQSSNLNVAQ